MSHRIDIKVGYSCNNHCLFCVQGDKRTRFKSKSCEEVRHILEKRRPQNDEVVFTGGEPTIRKDFLTLARIAKGLRYSMIQAQSNGRMFAYREFCEDAVASGVNNFALALHGSTAEIHDRLTCAPGSFEQTVQGIRNLKKLRQKVLTNTVITTGNYKDLPRIARFLISLGVNQIQFAFIHMSHVLAANHDLARTIVARKSAVKEYVKQGLQIGIDSNIPAMVEAIPYCFLDGYEQCISDRFFTPTSVEDNVSYIENFDEYRRQQGKAKGPQCVACCHYKVCEGPWKSYPELYGWQEFKPVKENSCSNSK